MVRKQKQKKDCPELGTGWKYKRYKCGTTQSGDTRYRYYYYSPTGQEFKSFAAAQAHIDSSTTNNIAEATTSATQDEGEVEEKKNDTTGASSSTLVDIQKTYPPTFGSSSTSGSMDINNMSSVDADKKMPAVPAEESDSKSSINKTTLLNGVLNSIHDKDEVFSVTGSSESWCDNIQNDIASQALHPEVGDAVLSEKDIMTMATDKYGIDLIKQRPKQGKEMKA